MQENEIDIYCLFIDLQLSHRSIRNAFAIINDEPNTKLTLMFALKSHPIKSLYTKKRWREFFLNDNLHTLKQINDESCIICEMFSKTQLNFRRMAQEMHPFIVSNTKLEFRIIASN